MYQCVKGYVTVGVGNLIDPVGMAMRIKWEAYDGGPAYPHEVEAEWHRVKGMPAGLLASRYHNEHSPFLSDETIDRIVEHQLYLNEAHLKKTFPDWDSWPADAQLATLSIAWAVGAGLQKWPKFRRACRKQDWITAARESHIQEKGNPGVIRRNEQQKIAFENASIATTNPEALDFDKAYWPLNLEPS